jgi:hypothetical protein
MCSSITISNSKWLAFFFKTTPEAAAAVVQQSQCHGIIGSYIYGSKAVKLVLQLCGCSMKPQQFSILGGYIIGLLVTAALYVGGRTNNINNPKA